MSFYNRNERNYKFFSRKEKRSYNAHKRLESRFTDKINDKYSKGLEIKAIYHGLCCDEMLNKSRVLTKFEKVNLFNLSKEFVNKTS